MQEYYRLYDNRLSTLLFRPRGHCGRDRMVVGFSTMVPMQSVPITTKAVSSNPIHGKVYSMHHYVIKFVSDLQQVCGFSPGFPVSNTIKTDCHDITEILLKVALNTITLTPLTERIARYTVVCKIVNTSVQTFLLQMYLLDLHDLSFSYFTVK